VKLIQLIKKASLYFVGLSIFLVGASLFLIVQGKANSFLLINNFHNQWFDSLFSKFTFLGDGIFALILCSLFLIFKKKRASLLTLITFIFSGLVAQLIKNIAQNPRPKLFFKPDVYVHFIDGVTVSNNFSFPSGHTTTAFAVATIIVLISEKKIIQFSLLLIAILVGYSRIYLGQHFLLDVITGAFIGTLSSLITVYFAEKWTRKQKKNIIK
jgi:membrane-associated phospholipid phosphatase